MLNEKQIKALNTISTEDGLKYFSGCDPKAKNSSFPLIYYSNDGFSVIGPGHKSWHNDLPDAVKVYEKFFKHSYSFKENL